MTVTKDLGGDLGGDLEVDPEVEQEEWRQALGFPSPADNYRRGRLDLNRQLVSHPAATFFARMASGSMVEEGIGEGDLVVIDRAERIEPGQLVVVRVGAEMLIRKLERLGDGLALTCCDAAPLLLTAELDWEFWGRVIYSIRKH